MVSEASGGGFNNYLGALRSRALIDGDGDRLTLTEAGIRALGSWEPLHMGAAVVRCSTTACGLPGTRSSATCSTNLPEKVRLLRLGMPDAGRDDY
jgi:hypothetical protein